MGQANAHGLGRERKFFVQNETTFGTFVAPLAAAAPNGAIKTLGSQMSFTQARVDRGDSRQHRSLVERITGKKEVTWSMNGYLIPPGDVGVTRPDIGILLEAAMGVEALDAAVDYEYSLSSDQTELDDCLSIVHHLPRGVMEACTGAWVDTFTISASGGDPVKISFEGGASDLITTSKGQIDGALSGAETTIVSDDSDCVQVGSRIVIGTSDGTSSTGHAVTSITDATDFVVTPAIVGAQANDMAILPFTPVEDTSGSPVAGIVGSFGIDSGTLVVTAAEITFSNNTKALNDEAFSAAATGFIRGWRSVSGTLTIRGRQDQFIELKKRQDFVARDLAIVFGSVAGSIITVDMNQVEMDFSTLDIPESEEATFTLPFTALATSAGDNEIIITFT